MKQLELCEEPIVNGRWFWVVCGMLERGGKRIKQGYSPYQYSIDNQWTIFHHHISNTYYHDKHLYYCDFRTAKKSLEKTQALSINTRRRDMHFK